MAETVRRISATRCAEIRPEEQTERALRTLMAHMLPDPSVARFALIEIYAGGPAALDAIASEERRLASALRGCLSRRSQRVPAVIATAIVFASLHCGQTLLIDASPVETAEMVEALISWARDVVDGRDELAIPIATSEASWSTRSAWGPLEPPPGDRDEEDLILAARGAPLLAERVPRSHHWHGEFGCRSTGRTFWTPLREPRGRLSDRDTSNMWVPVCRAHIGHRSRLPDADVGPQGPSQCMGARRV
jgi:hypothetical protein